MSRVVYFIGGPLDGQQKMVEHDAVEVHVYVPQPILLVDDWPGPPPMVYYRPYGRLSHFHGEAWTVDGQQPSVTNLGVSRRGSTLMPPPPMSLSDAMTVRFADMTREAEAEMAAWDKELKSVGKRRSK